MSHWHWTVIQMSSPAAQTIVLPVVIMCYPYTLIHSLCLLGRQDFCDSGRRMFLTPPFACISRSGRLAEMTIKQWTCRLLYKLLSVRHSRWTQLHLPDCPWMHSALLQQTRSQIEEKWFVFRLTLCSLFYNSLTSSWTVVDTLLEPMFWFVDHFVRYLGPVSCHFVFVH